MKKHLSASFSLLLTIMLFASCGEKVDDATFKKAQAEKLGQKDSGSDSAAPKDSLTLRLTAEDSTTVFDLTVANGPVEYDKTAQGYFVASINSIDQFDGYFWVYSVNDTMGAMASNMKKIGPGDEVVWYFRQIIP